MSSLDTINVRRKDVIYSDVAFSFGPNPISADVSRITNEEAVKQSIKNIVLTDRYERPFNPMFGCNVRKMLFENFTATTIALTRKLIIEAIKNFEPRAQIVDVRVDGDPDLNGITITIVFSIINSINPTTLSFYLTRVR